MGRKINFQRSIVAKLRKLFRSSNSIVKKSKVGLINIHRCQLCSDPVNCSKYSVFAVCATVYIYIYCSAIIIVYKYLPLYLWIWLKNLTIHENEHQSFLWNTRDPPEGHHACMQWFSQNFRVPFIYTFFDLQLPTFSFTIFFRLCLCQHWLKVFIDAYRNSTTMIVDIVHVS